ncbi:MAG TPA: nucleotidyltransferase domain-containing protein [Sphingobacterium sp.]|nr:nucleotidyltransferase domain-containing protein [Sphingobacterium sp.]
MVIKQEIAKWTAEFETICRQHKVKHLFAFGSSTNEAFDIANSDIDLLVDLDETDPLQKGEYLLDLWDNLEVFFQRKVDLLTPISIKNPYLKKSIDATKVLIYDGESSEIFV